MKKYVLLLALTFSACQPSTNSNSVGHTRTIIGGEIVEEDTMNIKSATVGLFVMSDGFGGQSLNGTCTGSYIGNNTVVTASHCTYFGATHVGFVTEKGIFYCPVTQTRVHPSYAKTYLPWFDVAVLKIQCKEGQLNDVATYELDSDQSLTEQVYAAGYGRVDGLYDENASAPGLIFPKLKKLALNFFDMAIALKDPEISEANKNSQFIAMPTLVEKVEEGQAVCFKASLKESVYYGDSGGPLFKLNSEKKPTLVGTPAMLYYKKAYQNGEINEKTEPSLYALCSPRISFYREWILKDE